MVVLGLDPGTLKTGFGVIEVRDGRLLHLDHGLIRLKESWSLASRLCALHDGLSEVCRVHKPHAVAIEKIFLGKNADSAFKLGHARGVCLLVAQQFDAQVHEYAARSAKKVVTGSGASSKDAVRLLVMQILKFQPRESAFDVTDALSLAICHAQTGEVNARIRKMMAESL